MTLAKIKATFNRTFSGSKNFMTPDVIRYGVWGRYIYELSSGSGFTTKEGAEAHIKEALT